MVWHADVTHSMITRHTVGILLIADLDRLLAVVAKVGQQVLVDVQSSVLRRAR